MYRGKPMFTPCPYPQYQLNEIFTIMGTPSTIIASNTSVPYCKPRDFSKVCKTIDEKGLDLLRKMVVLDPTHRISAEDALKHSYFTD